MESKIEKLERVKPMALMGMMGEVAPQWVAKELNRIIDHLNSQAQPEENEPEKVYVEPIVPNFTEELSAPVEYKTRKQVKEMFKDTPEEWSWKFLKGGCEPTDYSKQPKMEEELHDKLLEIWCGLLPTPSKASFDPEPIRIRIEGTEKYVKQLLDDREREAYHDGYTDGVTRCMDSLNKLEEDKNEGA